MKFIHFGCWNNGGCSETGTNGLSLMTKKLREYVSSNPIEFLAVAGDNYYPKKDEEGKHFNKAEFLSGFDCLPKEIKKYLIFGNHDIEDKVIDETSVPINCKLLDEQKKIVEENNTYEIFDDVIHKVIGDTLIIMFDSNLYENKEDKKIIDTCYSQLFAGFVNKTVLKIKDLMSYQNCYIKDLLTTHLDKKNIIFIGHHPIYSIKNKKENKDAYKLDRFISFIKQIQTILLEKNIYYLCADTHLYQEGRVFITPEIEIKQYIVGTGGAEQDKIYVVDNDIIENGHLVYRKSIERREFGFLEVDIGDSDINFKFISATEMSGGNKFKKYKILKKKY